MKSFNINTIRSDFPILKTLVHGKPLIYLDNAATTHKPHLVLDSIYNFYATTNSNVHRGTHFLSQNASELYEQARQSVRDFINAQSIEEVIFTSGTTASINGVAQSFVNKIINPGDEVLISAMEHHSNFLPWQILCKNKGAILKIIPIDKHGYLQEDQIPSLLTEKTKFIAITYISNVTGIINPVKRIIQLAHSFEIPILIDGAQSIAHIPVDVSDLDCDFFVFSGHKMYAETGIGILYGKEKWLDQMPPFQYGGGMISSVKYSNTTFAQLPFKFEAGTQNLAGAVSLGTAIKYINKIGLPEINHHENSLTNYAVEGLSLIKNLTLYPPSSEISGIISFNLYNVSAYDISLYLDSLGIAVRSGHHCAQPLMDHFKINGTVRASFAVYNTKQEINMLIDSIKKAQSILE